jgi:hypothetical protein
MCGRRLETRFDRERRDDETNREQRGGNGETSREGRCGERMRGKYEGCRAMEEWNERFGAD